jgi:membrane protein implicated in regulation of membrane protease activity
LQEVVVAVGQVEIAGLPAMKRLWVALLIYAVLAGLAWTTLSDPKFKFATLAILAMFAIRTWSWSRKQTRENRERHDKD